MTVDAEISQIDARAYTLPTEVPEADGTLRWDSTTLVTVRATAEGVGGLGWTYAPAATALLVRDLLAGTVIGRAAMNVVGTNDAMTKKVRNAGRPGVAASAISAIDVALWDLKSRLLELPLGALLGRVREKVPIYGSGGFTSYNQAQLDAALRTWTTEQAIPRVKIKIGQDWGRAAGRDLERVRHARRIIGDETELYVDANGGYTRKEAIRIAHALDESDVRWFEEPVTSDDLSGLGQVRARSSADIAAGEYGYTLGYFERMCGSDSVDCIQADVSRCGGITAWRDVAAIAASHSLDISGHCCPHLHAHIAAATPNLRHLEWFHDHVRIETRYFDGALDPHGGLICPTTEHGHGHGMELKEPDLAQFRSA